MTTLASCGAVQWGDVPTWVGAIGTLLAFAVALILLGQSVADGRKRQARMVSAWAPGGPTIIGPGLGSGETMTQRVEWLLYIYNLSDEIVSDVEAFVLSKDGRDVGIRPTRYTDIGPGQKVEVMSRMADDGRVRGELRVRVTFTDSAGRRWERMGGRLGKLRRESRPQIDHREDRAGTTDQGQSAAPP